MEDFNPMTIIFLSFFLLWNAMICLPTIRAFSGIFRGDCNSYIPALICPHWIIGITLPIFFSASGGAGGVVMGCFSFVVPYGVGVFWEVMACKRGERVCCPRNARLRAFCRRVLGATLQDAEGMDVSGRSDSEGSEGYYEDEEMGAANGRSSGGMWVGDKVDLNSMRPDERKLFLERILPVMETTTQTMCSICLGDYTHNATSKTKDDDNNTNNNTADNDSEHENTDTIERAKEEITHSLNKECDSHTFHKSCIVEWLMRHDDCPICRRTYICTPPPPSSNDDEEEDDGHEGEIVAAPDENIYNEDITETSGDGTNENSAVVSVNV